MPDRETRSLVTFGAISTEGRNSHLPSAFDPAGPTSTVSMVFSGGEDHTAVAKRFTASWSGDLAAIGITPAKTKFGGGNTAHTGYPTKSWAPAWASFPLAGRLASRAGAVDFLRSELIRAGGRPKVLGLLAWELEAEIDTLRAKAAAMGVGRDHVNETALGLLIASWGPRLEARLVQDMAIRSVRFPEAVREMHIGLSSDEFSLVRYVVRRHRTSMAGGLVCLSSTPAFWRSGVKSTSQALEIVAKGLVAKGWLIDLQARHDPNRGLLWDAARGPKARKLTNNDIVPVMLG